VGWRVRMRSQLGRRASVTPEARVAACVATGTTESPATPPASRPSPSPPLPPSVCSRSPAAPLPARLDYGAMLAHSHLQAHRRFLPACLRHIAACKRCALATAHREQLRRCWRAARARGGPGCAGARLARSGAAQADGWRRLGREARVRESVHACTRPACRRVGSVCMVAVVRLCVRAGQACARRLSSHARPHPPSHAPAPRRLVASAAGEQDVSWGDWGGEASSLGKRSGAKDGFRSGESGRRDFMREGGALLACSRACRVTRAYWLAPTQATTAAAPEARPGRQGGRAATRGAGAGGAHRRAGKTVDGIAHRAQGGLAAPHGARSPARVRGRLTSRRSSKQRGSVQSARGSQPPQLAC